MRRPLLILVIWVCACINSALVRGQVSVIYSAGVKSGITMSRFIEKGTRNDYLVSYLIGLSIEQRFTQRVSLSYDLLYSRQGNIVFLTNPGPFDKVRTKYNYFTLPVSLRCRFKRHPVILSPGFQVGYLVSNRTDFLPKGGYTNSIPFLKRSDLGFSFGLGYRFGTHFFGEVKYFESLIPLFKVAQAERYNQTISANLTCYPFTKK
ncbi:porin family protein [Spirosoma sordidisoli]